MLPPAALPGCGWPSVACSTTPPWLAWPPPVAMDQRVMDGPALRIPAALGDDQDTAVDNAGTLSSLFMVSKAAPSLVAHAADMANSNEPSRWRRASRIGRPCFI
jgi:hypothetical protein